jgi:flagellar hook-associated protein 3 FlgL
MRLSTSMFYELGMQGIQRQLSDQIDLQQKISAGKRVTKPSDDPVAASAVIGIDQAKGLNAQYGLNASAANASLGMEEQALSDTTRVLQDVKTLAINAGNPVLKNEDRASLAAQAQGLYEELLGIANRTDGQGQYMFSGYKGTTKPFSEVSPGVVSYAGDEGQRLLQIAPQRRITSADSGANIFQRIRGGNGEFVTTAPATNAGTGVATPGTVTNANAWNNPANSRDYSVVFHVDNTVVPPVTTYDIVDQVANVSMLTGAAPAAGPYARTYQPGVAIKLDREPGDPIVVPWDAGAQFELTGTPASGDTFSVKSSPMQDVFATVHQLIDTLNTGIGLTPSSQAVYQNNLNALGASLDTALDHILTARAAIGSRMTEIQAMQDTNQDLAVHLEEEHSRLVDLDYAQALSDATRKQVTLEAAQKSYLALTKLNLFDLL